MTEPELSWSAIDASLKAGFPVIHRRSGKPPVDFVVEKGGHALALWIPVSGSADTALPDALEFISTRIVTTADGPALEIRCSEPTRLRDFHALLTALVDRVQSGSVSPFEALSDTVADWRRLLQAEVALGTERQIGLWGELWFLRWLIGHHGSAAALAAWTGPEGEPHDFRFAPYEVEIKTTVSARRVHTIHGLTQLEPSSGCELQLVSVMIEPAGSSDGLSLGDAFEVTREMLKGSGISSFNTRLEHLGVDPMDPSRYRDLYRLRSEPQIVAVGVDFPRLTQGMLAPLLGAQFSRIKDVDYQVDLTGMAELAELKAASFEKSGI